MIDKLKPQKLDKSSDERIIPKTSMIDALNAVVDEHNITAGSDLSDTIGDSNVLKSTRSNTFIPYERWPHPVGDMTPTQGMLRVLGATTDNRGKVVYMYVWSNIPEEQGVFAYDPYGLLPSHNTTGRIHRVFQSEEFNFDPLGFVTGDVVYINNNSSEFINGQLNGNYTIENEKDPILYFTDNNSEPKKLNVYRSLLDDHDLDEGYNLTDYITACPKLGLHTISFEFYADTSRTVSNFTQTKGFQFAYQLIYRDGVESAISPYSDIAFPDVLIQQGSTPIVDHLANNMCLLQLPQLPEDMVNRTEISEIRLLAREGNEGSFLVIDQFSSTENYVAESNNISNTIWDATTYQYKFYNDRIVTGVDPLEVSKQFDSLPRKAEAQTVVNNRLKYANYLDGFDEVKVDCTTEVLYQGRPADFFSGEIEVRESAREIYGSGDPLGGAVNKTSSYIIDCRGLPSILPQGTDIKFQMRISPNFNFHLYDAKESYHQDCFMGDSRDYDAFTWTNSEGETENNAAEWSKTFQTPERSGGLFLGGCTTGDNEYGADARRVASYFGDNEGVLNNLTWHVKDYVNIDEESDPIESQTKFNAALGTSAGNPFIIPSSGMSDQITFSVTINVIQTLSGSAQEQVSRAICQALSGATDFSQTDVWSSYLQVSDVNYSPTSTISINKNYAAWDSFTDADPRAKLIMGVSGKTNLQGHEIRPGYSPKGYVLLNKGDIEFFLEQDFKNTEASIESTLEGQEVQLPDGYAEEGNNQNNGYAQHELRLGIKSMKKLAFTSCMRTTGHRQVTAQPYETGNGNWIFNEESTWFVLPDLSQVEGTFSLQDNILNIPGLAGSSDNLGGQIQEAYGSEFVNNIQAILFRKFPDISFYGLDDNLEKLPYPQCLSLYDNYDPVDEEGDGYELMFIGQDQNDIYYEGELNAQADYGFRFTCGYLEFLDDENQYGPIEANGEGYEMGGVEAQPSFGPDGPNTQNSQNIRFKFSLFDGEGGPGGGKRTPEGAASGYGSISYASTIYSSQGIGYKMTGIFWNGRVTTGYATRDSYQATFNDYLFYMPGVFGMDAFNPEISSLSINDTNLSANYDESPHLSIFNNEGDIFTYNDNNINSALIYDDRIYTREAKRGNIEAYINTQSFGDNEDRSFKTHAYHSFGIVYYDERGRHGFVNPIDPVYVPGYSDAERGTGNKGRVNILFNLAQQTNLDPYDGEYIEDRFTPPDWATHFKIVYGLNTSVSKFTQYASGGAYVNQTDNFSDSSLIYVSLNYLQESQLSYTSAFGARGPEGEINMYKFKDGDRVRIISYSDSGNQRIYPQEYVFDVVDLKIFGPLDNPLSDSQVENADKWHQGQFLVLRNNPEIVGFNHASVQDGNDLWGDRCVIEIFSPKKQKDQIIYYEVPNQSFVDDQYRLLNLELNENYGQIMTTNPSIRRDLGDNLAPVHYPNRLIMTQGDVWWRPIALNTRKLVDSSTGLQNVSNAGFLDLIENPEDEAAADAYPGEPNFLNFYVESETASDLIDGDSSFIGRPNAYLADATEARREATITYSEFSNPESKKVNFSSFNAAVAPFKDLREEFGAINFLGNDGGDVIAIQENAVTIVPAGKNVLADSAGSDTVVASLNVLGSERTMAQRAGTDNNPESVQKIEGAFYFAHKGLGQVYKYTPNGGVSIISDKGMKSYFRDLFDRALQESVYTDYRDIRVVGGHDPITHQYILTVLTEPNLNLQALSDASIMDRPDDDYVTLEEIIDKFEGEDDDDIRPYVFDPCDWVDNKYRFTSSGYQDWLNYVNNNVDIFPDGIGDGYFFALIDGQELYVQIASLIGDTFLECRIEDPDDGDGDDDGGYNGGYDGDGDDDDDGGYGPPIGPFPDPDDEVWGDTVPWYEGGYPVRALPFLPCAHLKNTEEHPEGIYNHAARGEHKNHLANSVGYEYMQPLAIFEDITYDPGEYDPGPRDDNDPSLQIGTVVSNMDTQNPQSFWAPFLNKTSEDLSCPVVPPITNIFQNNEDNIEYTWIVFAVYGEEYTFDGGYYLGDYADYLPGGTFFGGGPGDGMGGPGGLAAFGGGGGTMFFGGGGMGGELEIQENLYTSGGEYMLRKGDEYIGDYHLHSAFGAMVGATHINEPHERLFPYVPPPTLPPPPDPSSETSGCTDPTALNYDPEATKDDGSCVYKPKPQRVDPMASPSPVSRTRSSSY